MPSCYILEFSVEAGSARHGEGHVYSDLSVMERCLSRLFGMTSSSGAEEYHVGLVFYPATIALWVVQRGRVEHAIDLRPFLTMTFDDGRAARLDDPGALAPLRDDFNRDPGQRVRFTLDTATFAAAVPPLEPPLLRPGGSIDADLAPGLTPGFPSYLDHGIELEHGSWDLEEGSRLDDDEGDDPDDD